MKPRSSVKRWAMLAVTAILASCNSVLGIPEVQLRDDPDAQARTPSIPDDPELEIGFEDGPRGEPDAETKVPPRTGDDCEDGFDDCNRDPKDGCEADLRSDPQRCGDCDEACPAGFTCSAGVCLCTANSCTHGGTCNGRTCVCDGVVCEEGAICKEEGECD